MATSNEKTLEGICDHVCHKVGSFLFLIKINICTLMLLWLSRKKKQQAYFGVIETVTLSQVVSGSLHQHHPHSSKVPSTDLGK